MESNSPFLSFYFVFAKCSLASRATVLTLGFPPKRERDRYEMSPFKVCGSSLSPLVPLIDVLPHPARTRTRRERPRVLPAFQGDAPKTSPAAGAAQIHFAPRAVAQQSFTSAQLAFCFRVDCLAVENDVGRYRSSRQTNEFVMYGSCAVTASLPLAGVSAGESWEPPCVWETLS